MSKRFNKINEKDVEKFNELEENQNTKRKTELDINLQPNYAKRSYISSSKLIWNFPNYFCNFANPLKNVANLLMEFAMFLS